LFFQLVDYIRKNYQYYADLFRFDHRQFRNDIAFSVAKHILDGFESSDKFTLPSLLTVQDRDVLTSVKEQQLSFLISTQFNQNYVLASTQGVDLHIMNKQSIVRNKDQLLALI
jgi:flagellar assembly factor FliW